MMSCVAIIAFVCLHNVDMINFYPSTVLSYVSFTVGEIDGRIVLSSDFDRIPDWGRMNVACNEGGCVSYFKHCEDEGNRQVCNYHFSQLGDRRNTIIELRGRDREVLLAAESGIGILTRSAWLANEILVARFEVISPGREPPYCALRRGASISNCWPSDTTGR